jgi:hypothetical protein
MEEFNPYAAPKAEVLAQVSEAETIRRKHINRESSVKTLGCLYVLGGVVVAFGIVFSLVGRFESGVPVSALLEQGLVLLVGVTAIAVGVGLRMLKRWASITAITLGVIMCVMNLFALPASILGVVIQVAIVLTLLGAKTRMVVSEDYKRIITETPHVKLRTSVVTWVLLALLLAILAFAIISAVVQ